METLEIQAKNIKCGGCVSTIEDGLKGFESISNIDIDIPSNLVKVEGDNLDQKQIEEKLKELGYF